MKAFKVDVCVLEALMCDVKEVKVDVCVLTNCSELKFVSSFKNTYYDSL